MNSKLTYAEVVKRDEFRKFFLYGLIAFIIMCVWAGILIFLASGNLDEIDNMVPKKEVIQHASFFPVMWAPAERDSFLIVFYGICIALALLLAFIALTYCDRIAKMIDKNNESISEALRNYNNRLLDIETQLENRKKDGR